MFPQDVAELRALVTGEPAMPVRPLRDRPRFALRVSEGQHVRAEAFDALGRRVAVVFEGAAAPGAPTPLVFDGSALPPGPYLVRVTGEAFTTSARVTVAR